MKAFPRPDRKALLKCEQAGFSVLEVLLAIGFLAIVATGVAANTVLSYQLTKRAIRAEIASELARSRFEELVATDPATLNEGNNQNESGIVAGGVSFSRQTIVTVNSDGSRRLQVSVSPTDGSRGRSVQYEETVSLWGVN